MEAYVLVIFISIGIGIIWAISYFISKAEQKEKEGPLKKVEKEKTDGRTQESLDSLYASSREMWVCKCCETLNDGGDIQCSACGAKK